VKVAAGVLHYRFWPGVQETVDGLLAQSRPPDDIVLVDHASEDGSSERIRESYPGLRLIQVESNRGPTAGMNQLMRALLATGADAIFILPHDFKLAPDALEHLVARMDEAPEVGAAGPLIGYLDDPERVFYAGGTLDPRNWELGFHHTPDAMAGWIGRPPSAVDWLELGGLLVRAEAAQAAGLLAEDLYYWIDDVDFTMRIRSLGWRIECVPAAKAWQDLGEPPIFLQTRNRLGLIARNASRRQVIWELLRMGSWLVRDFVRPRDGVRRADLWQRLRGIAAFLTGRWGAP
jgi:GT2 family glycosyltransferase